MSAQPVNLSLPENFDGTVRLFPLPNLVLFPGVIQALHIFEQRYRTMVADALADDRLIAMTMLKSDGDVGIGQPAIMQTICIGKILTHTQFDDGRYNLLLTGTHRARIVQEIAVDKPYRVAKVEVFESSNDYAPDDADALKQQVSGLFTELVASLGNVPDEVVIQTLDQDLSLGQMVDLVCYACNAEPSDQQRVLEIADVCRRAEHLLIVLKRLIVSRTDSTEGHDGEFPPGFSEN